MTERLREKIASHSVWPSDVVGKEPSRVLIVPPTGDLAAGFQLAQTLGGSGLRLVGHGASLRHTWPAWVNTTEGLVLTELGAYVARSPIAGAGEIRLAVSKWLDRLFEGALEGLRGSEVFYGQAAARFLQPLFEAGPFVRGLAEAHPDARFHVSDPRWVGARMLQAAVGPRGAVENLLKPPSRLRFGAVFSAQLAACLAGTIADQAREFVRARSTLEMVRSRYREGSPRLWAAIVADWPRLNRNLVESLLLPELRAGRRLGVLLYGRLVPGARKESSLRDHEGSELAAGLGSALPHLDELDVEQVATPSAPGHVASTLARVVRTSLEIGRRLVRSGGMVEEGTLSIDLTSHAFPLAKLISLDLARALLAHASARELVGRRSFSGSVVVFAGSGMAQAAAADLVLQSSGATTIEHWHGAGMEGWIGWSESRSSYRCVWTKADGTSMTELGRRHLVGGMPVRPVAKRSREERHETHVLVLSNYCHRDYQVEGRFPYEPFQREMLAAAEQIRERWPEVIVRWRPHPADDTAAVERGRRLAPGLKSSEGTTLEEDLGWADVVLSSMSTTVVESMVAGRPTLVHVPPEFQDAPNGLVVDPNRVFFRAGEGVERFGRIFQAFGANEDPCKPEDESRLKLFGTTRLPRSLGEALRGEGLLQAEGRS